MEYIGKNGRYSLASQPMKQGGEGAIYSVTGRNDLVAKIYFKDRVSAELSEKLSFMANNPPDSSILSQIAWPQDVLRDANGNFVGFVMPKLKIDADLKDIYVYPPKKGLQITYEQKIIIAINICIVISAIHKAGYTFGDFNPLNIGVNLTTGHVAFLDTDSYHIYDKYSRKMYRCGVCLDGYVAPELIKQCKGTDYLSAPLPTFTQETDKFALAIHIFKLLMNGFTPFNGIKETDSVSQASPGRGNQAIEKDNYCFKAGNKPQSVATPDLSAFPPDIQYLFKRAFIDGRDNPEDRPSADEWYKALLDYKKNLVQCKRDKTHFYYVNDRECPYCAAEERYNLRLGKSSSSNQMTFSQPISVPGTSNRTTYGNSTYSPSSSSSPSVGSNTSSYVGAGNSYSSTSYKKKGGFTKKLIGLVITLSLLLVGATVGFLAYVNPITDISFTAPSNANAILYGTTLEEMDFQLQSHQIFGGWKDVDLSNAVISGYSKSTLGEQTITVSYAGKTASVQVNVIPVDLSTPSLQVSYGKITIDYDAKYTENLIFEINGTEYIEKPTKEYKLPGSFDAGTYTIKVKSVNNNNFVNDSDFSDSITVKKLQAIELGSITNGILSFEASSESNLYDVYVDGDYYKSITGNEFDLNSVDRAGQHSVTIAVKPTEITQLYSNQSESISYTMLSNNVSFSVDSGCLTWAPISNATGYEFYVSGRLVSTYGTDIPSLDIMSFYSEAGFVSFTVKVLGDGNEYINSSMSAVYKHTFTDKYVPLRTVDDLYKLNNSNERFILINDIDLSSVSNWTPIENFSGYFFGNNKAIKNLTINTSGSNIGFFSTLSGTVDHLDFENANIIVSGNNENIGILSGQLKDNSCVSSVYISGTIVAESSNNIGALSGKWNVSVTGTPVVGVISDVTINGNGYVGGIIGYLNGSIWVDNYTLQLSEWSNSGNITATRDYVGGLIGFAVLDDTGGGSYYYKLNVNDCSNTGNISGKTYVGGLFGYAKSDSTASCITGCSNSSSVSGEAYVGCIAGCLEYISLDDCKNSSSSLTATKYVVNDSIKCAYIGGFVGKGYGVNNCINEVSINYTAGGRYVGGVMGYCFIDSDTTFSNVFNTATINGNDYVGGIIGYLNGSIWVDNYTLQLSEWSNSGNITATGDYVGGLIGFAVLDDTGGGSYYYKLNVIDCNNTGNISGKTYVGGLFGYAKSDSKASTIIDSSSSGLVNGSSDYGKIAGKLENITLK